VYHIVNWSKDLGGAGITPGLGKWENVKAIFPIHNSKVNQSLLKYLSRKFFLSNEDIDQIRNLHGSKVHLYHSFVGIRTYNLRSLFTLLSYKLIFSSSPSPP
jgi:hypothetical protein